VTETGVPASAGFGWSVSGLNNHSACAYFLVTATMTLQGVTVDAALQPSVPTTAGGAQVLCRGWVSRGAPPAFVSGASGPTGPSTASADFGAPLIFNPSDLSVASDIAPLQDVFYSSLLRSWVPVAGTDAPTAHSVSVLPALNLSAGDYLVFGVAQQGVAGSLQLQAVLTYQS
jgi:hypothetical protein